MNDVQIIENTRLSNDSQMTQDNFSNKIIQKMYNLFIQINLFIKILFKHFKIFSLSNLSKSYNIYCLEIIIFITVNIFNWSKMIRI